jgi:signal transduction histidine kinase
MAYGVAVGVEMVAVAVFASAGLARRSRGHVGLHPVLLTSLAAGGTLWLCALETPKAREPSLGAVDWPFTVASLVLFVPFAWAVGLAFARADDAGLPVAPLFLILVLLFAVNRYDSLVAAGTVDTVYLQPFVLPAFLTFAGVRATWRVMTRRRSFAAVRETAATDERNRIARDLHDSVSQTLYSIAMVAEALPRTVQRDPAAGTEQARQIRSMTLETLGNLRILLLEMRHPAPESDTLGELLRELGEGPGAPVVVELDVTGKPGEPGRTADLELAAYRVAQEALMNAHRHADPRRIVVRLEQRADALTLRIADDGVGFDPRTPTAAHHGLEIMRERAAQVGARLTIESAPGRGTQVTFAWPHTTGDTAAKSPKEAP